jgi:hypothetical protein
MSDRLHLRWWVLAAVLVAASEARAAEPWDPFVGVFEGEAISETDGVLGRRDLEVTISQIRRGFNVTWVAVTHKDDGRVKRKEYSIDFRPTRRANVFASEMRKDLFGNRVPLNPLRGDPYVWARIQGETLSVFLMLVTDSGGYEMQIYHRTLTETGLQVRYSRLAENQVMRTVEGTLKRKP